ncbi:MAG: hypothetical protein ACX936_10840 [Marinobacter sp.]
MTDMKMSRKFKISKEETLGLLFHGRLDQFAVRSFAYRKLDRAASSDQIFEAQRAHTQWKRAEHKILYGRPLSLEQNKTIKNLVKIFRTPKTDLVKLLYARAITKSGRLRWHEPLQTGLAFLTLLNAGLAFLWIFLASHDLIVNSGASLPAIALAMFIILCIPGLPAVYLAYGGMAPLLAYRRLSKAAKRIGVPLQWRS